MLAPLLVVLYALLHQTMYLEPVGSAPVPGSRLGHPDHEAFPQSASFAGSPVLLVDDALVVVLAFLNDGLVVAGPAKEGLASFTGEGSEVKPGCWLFANSAKLVLHRIQSINLKGNKQDRF